MVPWQVPIWSLTNPQRILVKFRSVSSTRSDATRRTGTPRFEISIVDIRISWNTREGKLPSSLTSLDKAIVRSYWHLFLLVRHCRWCILLYVTPSLPQTSSSGVKVPLACLEVASSTSSRAHERCVLVPHSPSVASCFKSGKRNRHGSVKYHWRPFGYTARPIPVTHRFEINDWRVQGNHRYVDD